MTTKRSGWIAAASAVLLLAGCGTANHDRSSGATPTSALSEDAAAVVQMTAMDNGCFKFGPMGESDIEPQIVCPTVTPPRESDGGDTNKSE